MSKDFGTKIKNIINQANKIKDYQQKSYYIHAELEKMNLSWDYIEFIKYKISKEYKIQLLY